MSLQGNRRYRQYRKLSLTLAITVLGGLILLYAEYGLILPWSNADRSTGIPIKMTSVSANGSSETIELSEGDVIAIVIDGQEISLGSGTYESLFNLDYLGFDIKLTAQTTQDFRRETLQEGDCIIVQPFMIVVGSVKNRGPQHAKLVVTKLEENVNVNSCTISPTPTPIGSR